LTAKDDYVYGKSVNPFLADYSIIDPRTKRNRVFLSQEADCTFLIKLFRKIDKVNEQNLFGYDLVKIKHTEIQADLTADIDYDLLGQPQVYLRNYEGEYKEEKTSLFSIWSIEHEKFECAGEKFENQENSNKYQIQIRARNFLTGK